MTEQEARAALVYTLAAHASSQAIPPITAAFQRFAEGLRPIFDGLGAVFREMGRYVARMAVQMGPAILRGAFLLRFQRESERLARAALPAPDPDVLAIHQMMREAFAAAGKQYNPTLAYIVRDQLALSASIGLPLSLWSVIRVLTYEPSPEIHSAMQMQQELEDAL